ncbi:MAG: single-stranded DNA-binding protein [Rickettsiales bacterium]|jgi:single-strand DNA-binding protein|nr:single-stranded DNA-binding protein [Rickettsiales bacterium]
MSINKVILIGNVGKDPEIRSMNNGNEVALFSLATSEYWRDKATGEKKDKTEWHRIVVYSQGLVNIIKSYVKRGTKLYVSGSIQTRRWTDAQGAEKYATEIILQGYTAELQILEPRTSAGGSSSQSNFDDNYYSNVADSVNGGGSGSETDKGNFVEKIIDDNIPF